MVKGEKERDKNKLAKSLFSKLAENYDKISKIVTKGRDTHWRNKVVYELSRLRSGKVLDIGTGTGEIPLMLHKKNRKLDIIGIDISKEMINIAKAKAKNTRKIKYMEGRAGHLDFEDNTFDAVVSAFSLGNFENIGDVISEAHRVLKENGKLVLLDINKRSNSIPKQLSNLYHVFSVAPVMDMRTKEELYAYVKKGMFDVDRHVVEGIVKNANFRNVKVKQITLGTAFILTAVK